MADDQSTPARPRIQFPDFSNTPFVQEHADAAVQYAVERVRDSQIWFLRRSRSACQSPLEVAFALWWAAMQAVREISDDYFYLEHQHEVKCGAKLYRLDGAIVLQPNIVYKLDQIKCPLRLKIAVELDGHDFHERTKEQVTQRNERDRALQAEGWKVLHYSGSEFHRDPHSVVESVYGAAFTELWRLERQHHIVIDGL